MGGRSKKTKALIEFTTQAEKDLKKLQKKLSTSVIDDFHIQLESISDNPFSGKPLSGNLSGLYGIRFGGNYRIVYKVIRQDEDTIVRIFEIGDRKDIYKRTSRNLLL